LAPSGAIWVRREQIGTSTQANVASRVKPFGLPSVAPPAMAASSAKSPDGACGKCTGLS
jgi:hypothetical protein